MGDKQKRRAAGDPHDAAELRGHYDHQTILARELNDLSQSPFRNPALPIEERIDNLLAIMTPEEKAILFAPRGIFLPRLGFGITDQVEGYHGAALGGPANWNHWPYTPTTQFCQAIGLAATWDPQLVKQAAEAEAIEFRYAFHKLQKGGLIVRAPNADLGRDIRWGRTEECYGEDPFLSGSLTAAFVKGLQGDHPRYIRTAALLKHFLANSNEDNRSTTSADFDERQFREYYSAAFRMGFQEGGARCYMAAYNAYNGIPCHVHPFIREITLKEKWVDGIICTDGGGLGLLVTDHKYYPTLGEAAAACIKAGINQFLDPKVFEGIQEAQEHQLITQEDIDEAIRGCLRILLRLGLLDPPELVPYTQVGNAEPWFSSGHQTLAREITRKSIVLLKNSGGLLPLNRQQLRQIAVIGQLADAVHLDWYSGTPPYRITPLAGITKSAGSQISVSYAARQQEAVEAAKAAEVAVVCIGNHPTCHDIGWAKSPYPSEGKEAVDRQTINLEPHDLEFVQQVFRANPRTIVVLIASFPYAIPWLAEHIPALLHMTHNSQETGNALADILFGDYNPAGRLVQTWPRSLAQLPEMPDYNIRNGRTYMYGKSTPLFPFGYGLSYTNFTYSPLKLSAGSLATGETLEVSVEVTNTGILTGEEVVQMYVRYPGSAVARPLKQLQGFKRVLINAGETVPVNLPLAASQLAYWEVETGRWVLESGFVQILIGGSSADRDLSKPVTILVKGSP